MRTSKTPTVGRRFIALHTQTLTDTDLILTGDTARLVHTLLLLLSATHGLEGRVPTDARRLDLVFHLDGGAASVDAALEALRAAGKLVDEHEGTAHLADWEMQAEDAGGSKSRSGQARVAQPVRRHHEGAHDSKPYDGCTACALNIPSTASAHDQSTNAKGCSACADLFRAHDDEPATAAPDHVTTSQAEPTSTEELVEQFQAAIPEVMSSAPFRKNRLDGYRFLLDQADEVAAAHEGISSGFRGRLRNTVLADALEHYLGDVLEPKHYAACFRGAKALSAEDGHYWWILAAQAAAGCTLTAGREAGYLKTVAASKRGEWLAGGAA